MDLLSFEPAALPAGIARWRHEVRDFIASHCAGIPAERRANAWSVFDAGFSRALGERGWIGLTWPRRYEGAKRHEGLSQFLVDLKSPGVTVRPIVDLAGEIHFNEVFFDDVAVPHDMLLGREGEGWAQCTSELSLERSGPERYLSSHALFVE